MKPFFYSKVVGLPTGATVVPTSAGPASRLLGPTNARTTNIALLGGTEDKFLFRWGLPHLRIGLADAKVAGFVTNGINRTAELTGAP